MKKLKLSAGLVAGLLLVSGTALAQTKSAKCDTSRVPEKVEAQVVKVDTRSGRVTVRETNGTIHEFQASKETLQDLKPGDRIEATLRSAPNC